MKKLIVFIVLCVFTLFYFNIEPGLDQQAAYLKFVEEHPFSKTMYLSKKAGRGCITVFESKHKLDM